MVGRVPKRALILERCSGSSERLRGGAADAVELVGLKAVDSRGLRPRPSALPRSLVKEASLAARRASASAEASWVSCLMRRVAASRVEEEAEEDEMVVRRPSCWERV